MWLTVKKVLAPSHLVGVPTALNQKMVNVQNPHVLPCQIIQPRVQRERTGSLWSLVKDHRSRGVLLVLQLHQLAA